MIVRSICVFLSYRSSQFSNSISLSYPQHIQKDTELATEIEKTIQQADGSAYMAIFTTTSTSGVPPAKYYKDAKVEIERCAKALDELAGMIGL